MQVKIAAESAGIYFYVQIGNRTFPKNEVLRYDNQVSNAGGGMNLKTGTFTAPKAGVYIFSFSLLKEGFSFDHLTVSLRLNRTVIGGNWGWSCLLCKLGNHAVRLEVKERGSD